MKNITDKSLFFRPDPQDVHVIKNDGNLGIQFPEKNRKEIHRIVVAFGGKGITPFKYSDSHEPFVHIFDKKSCNYIIRELDTILDFIDYLQAKEKFYQDNVETLFEAGEEDLLGYYMLNNKIFPDKPDLLILSNDLFRGYRKMKRKSEIKKEIKISRFWDRFIEKIGHKYFESELELGTTLDEVEIILRVMAMENRYNRYILSKSIKEFSNIVKKKIRKSSSRFMISPSSVCYILLFCSKSFERSFRRVELYNRCFYLKGLNKSKDTFIGIALESLKQRSFKPIDILFLKKSDWTTRDEKEWVEIKKTFKYRNKSELMKD